MRDYVPSPEDFCPNCKLPTLYITWVWCNGKRIRETQCVCGCDLEPLPIEEVASWNGVHGVVQDPTVALARGGKYCPPFKIRRSVRFVPNSNVNLLTTKLMKNQFVNALHSHAKTVHGFRQEMTKPITYELDAGRTLIELDHSTLLILTDVLAVSVRRNDISVCDADWNVSLSVLTHSLHALTVCPKLSHLGFLLHGPLNPTQKRLVRPSNDV